MRYRSWGSLSIRDYVSMTQSFESGWGVWPPMKPIQPICRAKLLSCRLWTALWLVHIKLRIGACSTPVQRAYRVPLSITTWFQCGKVVAQKLQTIYGTSTGLVFLSFIMSSRTPYAGTSRKLALAFDVGTTYSGISYR